MISFQHRVRVVLSSLNDGWSEVARTRLSRRLVVIGAVMLAIEPARWLVGTWFQEGYDGIGWVAFLLAGGAFLFSLTSPLRKDAIATPPRMIYVLLGTAALRLVSQVLDINVVGALLLCVDVYVLAHLARLPQRRRSIAPFWLGALFAFCLPIEPMVQRLLGYGLQQLSAFGACGMLTPLFPGLICNGLRLTIDGVDVLVDVPCSGAELLSLATMMFCLVCTIVKPGMRAALAAGISCIALALFGNALRISVLAVGIVFADEWPVNVMNPWPHAMLGMLIVGAVTVCNLSMIRRCSRMFDNGEVVCRDRSATSMKSVGILPAGIFVCFALIVGSIQPQPVDASASLPPLDAPRVAADFLITEHTLSDQEKRYFTRYGGSATRASYGPFGLLMVSTTSPLRHLHDPTICLEGMGYRVKLLGTDHESAATVYEATRIQDGELERFRVSVSYLADDGRTATNISEVVWRWASAPGQRWTMIQRIAPDPLVDATTHNRWEAAMRRAFNLTS